MSIVANGQVRMAYLSVVASRSVNGVAALHTQLLKQRLMSDFAEIYLTVLIIKPMELPAKMAFGMQSEFSQIN